MNVQGDDERSPNGLCVHALERSVGDSDVLCDTSRWGDDGDANSSDPNIGDGLCSGMDATILANNPNRMVSASIPTMVPKTNHK
mgnify:FL=1